MTWLVRVCLRFCSSFLSYKHTVVLKLVWCILRAVTDCFDGSVYSMFVTVTSFETHTSTGWVKNAHETRGHKSVES